MLTRTKWQEELGTRCMNNPHRHPHPPRKHSELRSPMKFGTKQKHKQQQLDRRGPNKKPYNEPVKLERSPTKTTLRRTEPYKMLKRTKQLRRRVPIEEGLAKSSKKQHLENTDRWHLCKTGGFSYGESPRTPPLEGTSLHRWNNSVERPWGILSLFTTCLWLCVKSPCHRLWHVDYPWKAH